MRDESGTYQTRARRGSTEHRERISRGRRRQLSLRRVLPNHLRALVDGVVHPSTRPFVRAGEEEFAEIAEALGGADGLSPQRRSLLTDAVALGVLARATAACFLAKPDPELITKVSTTVSARRKLLEALGLDWHIEERGVEELARDHEAGPGAEEPDPEREERAQAIAEALREADWAPGEPQAGYDDDDPDEQGDSDGDQGAE